VMMATVFLSNPLTWFPQIAGSLWVGSRLMGLDLMPMLHEASYRNLAGDLHKLWSPCSSARWCSECVPQPSAIS